MKLTSELLITLLLCVLAVSSSARERLVFPQNSSSGPIRVTINGTPIAFSPVEPYMEAGRVLVPMRGVFEHLGVALRWDAKSRSVVAQLGERSIVLPLNSTNALVNGKETQLDVPARITRGRTMVPLRFLAESLMASVRWIPGAKTVQIVKGGSVEIIGTGRRSREVVAVAVPT